MADDLPGLDADAVAGYLADHVEGVTPPVRFRLITGGHSNITYAATDAAGRRYVVRRPPLGHVLATAHDMAREHRIISALHPTPVPVAPALALCPDTTVNGAPFYVMAFVDGPVVTTALEAERDVPDPRARQVVGEHVADILADLHRVDVDAVGLGDLARREDFLGRQLKRWQGQWTSSKTRDLPDMERAHAALVAARPRQRFTGIVHGDYRMGNFILRPEGGVAAVLDWELCTLGDVLADVGYLLNNWVQPGEDLTGLLDPPPTAAGGFGDRDALLARYAARSGIDVSDVQYYRAFSTWRSAAIAEGVKRRYLEGVMVDDTFPVAAYDERVAELAARALELLADHRSA